MKEESRRQNISWSLLWLVGGFVVFVGTLLPQTANYPFYADDFDNFERARQMFSDPLLPWVPILPHNRLTPFFFYFFLGERLLFGFQAMAYFLVLFCLHFFNSVLLFRLCRALGGSRPVSILSGLLFLFSSSFYQNLIFIHAAIRILCISFFLLAALSWLKFLGEPRRLRFIKVVAFQILSHLTMEDATVFPFLATFLALRLAPRKEWRRGGLIPACLVLFAVDILMIFFLSRRFFASPYLAEKIFTAARLAPNLFGLTKMLIQPFLIPERGFLPFAPPYETFFRLAPLVVCFIFALFLLRERLNFFLKGISSPAFYTALGWTGIAAFPFLFNPLGFEHMSRYLYLPMVGFAQVLGMGMYRFFETARAYLQKKGVIFCYSVLIFVLALNVSSTAFHYQRYVKFAKEHPEERYYELVKKTFETGGSTPGLR